MPIAQLRIRNVASSESSFDRLSEGSESDRFNARMSDRTNGMGDTSQILRYAQNDIVRMVGSDRSRKSCTDPPDHPFCLSS